MKHEFCETNPIADVRIQRQVGDGHNGVAEMPELHPRLHLRRADLTTRNVVLPPIQRKAFRADPKALSPPVTPGAAIIGNRFDEFDDVWDDEFTASHCSGGGNSD